MNNEKSRLFEAFILGLCSIATQTIYIKLILSSQVGGELYAALAIGGWIAFVGGGAILGSRIKKDKRKTIWFLLGALKIPLAFFIFIYPSFFTGVLDPLRFMPLVILGMAPSGILYGMLFPFLITGASKTPDVYRNEAVGSILGGLLTIIFSYYGVGGFAVLFLLSGIEISRAVYYRTLRLLILPACLIIGFVVGPDLDRAGLDIRWPGFKTIRIAHGFSGLWAVHSRENQLTITRNGEHLQTIPDRQSAEEALLWPLLYCPDAKEILLVGFEGFETKKYLPVDVHITKLINDRAFFRLGIEDDVRCETGDLLSYRPDSKYDLINVFLSGGGNLNDYRFETDLFFASCRNLLESEGVLYVSAVSDENYISPELSLYLSAIKNTLEYYFESVLIVPGPRIGLVCGRNFGTADPIQSLNKLRIDSPYFNQPLIASRLTGFRVDVLRDRLEETKISNRIFMPSSMINYLRWIGTMFGHSKYLFQIYIFPYPLLIFPILIIIPLYIHSIRKSDFISLFSVMLLGSLGMASEIATIYIFQILFGFLYLHIGLIISVFMAGMAAGAHFRRRLKLYGIMGPIWACLIILLFLPPIIETEFGLKCASILLYLLAAASGFCSGGGFALIADREPGGRRSGATLYGVDLYGATAAAIFVPGILIVFGVSFLFWSLIVIGLVISATLWYSSK